jgi:hypothetical protein
MPTAANLRRYRQVYPGGLPDLPVTRRPWVNKRDWLRSRFRKANSAWSGRKVTQRNGFNRRLDYPTLKHDIMIGTTGSAAVGDLNEAKVTQTIPAGGSMWCMVWSPSYRVRNSTGRERDRATTNVLFVGFRDHITIAGVGNVMHRRVVFWSRVRISEGMLCFGYIREMIC